MGRRASIDTNTLLKKLTVVFKQIGFEGASLSLLEKASGLKKASLYHRFPQGKESMAKAILAEVEQELRSNLFDPLRSSSTCVDAKMQYLQKALFDFYDGGRNACLLNMLAASTEDECAFFSQIKGMLELFEESFAQLAKESGFSNEESKLRARRALMLLQGSLVYCRGINSIKPFEEALIEIKSALTSQL